MLRVFLGPSFSSIWLEDNVGLDVEVSMDTEQLRRGWRGGGGEEEEEEK